MKKVFTAIIVILALSKVLNAQDGPKQAINVCAVAIPVMNMYVFNYEYLYKKRHGLAARAEYAPKLEGADTKGTAWAVVFDYRWHFSPGLKNFFVGPYARYRYVEGAGAAEGTDYNFNVPGVNLGLNGGYRWVSKIGVNVVVAAGYGYSFSKENISSSNTSVNSVFSKFKDENNTLLDAPFYGEFSVGYAF